MRKSKIFKLYGCLNSLNNIKLSKKEGGHKNYYQIFIFHNY